MISIFKKTFKGLTKTRSKIANAFVGIVGKSYLNPEDIDSLEEALLQSDMGWELTDYIIEKIGESDKKGLDWTERFFQLMTSKLAGKYKANPLKKVILVVGINGTGKTTSSAKLAGYFSNNSSSVSLVAADTYRAAAVEQIRQWSHKLGVQLVANEGSADPASVAFDGVKSGLTNNIEKIIVDTAGRLHTSPNLMKELEKIYRVSQKLTNEMSVLITIDANTGQNGLTQVKEFGKYLPIDGVVLTKMDGTARGGIAVSIMHDLNLPIYFMGVGEQIDDLIPFSQDDYLKGLIGLDKESLVNE